MPLIPLIASAIIGALSSALVSLLGRALLALGISSVTYIGLDLMSDRFTNYINSRLTELGQMPNIYAGLDALGVIAFIKMHLAAVTAVFSIIAAQKFIRMMTK